KQASNVRVDAITDLAAAQSRWEALEAVGAGTPFQSFAWVSSLAKTVGRACSAETLVLIVREVASGRDLMLLPVVRRSLGPIRMIELPDFGAGDYSAPVAALELPAAPARFQAMWKSVLPATPPAALTLI